MKKTHISLIISISIVTFLIGLAVGYFISPSYQQTMYTKEDMGLGVADRFVDLRYINAMAAHHRGAILLANQIAGRSQRGEINSLATDIQQNEPKLINELYQWKKEWYSDTRMVKDPVVANIGGLDETTDLRFLNALIAHHEAGITMTREIRSKSSRKEVLNNADAIENFLSTTLITLKAWRLEWFKVN